MPSKPAVKKDMNVSSPSVKSPGKPKSEVVKLPSGNTRVDH